MTAKRKLLLVEDDPSTAKAIQFMYSRRGWDVTVAFTLKQGLLALAIETPEAIILDLMLPDGDGSDLLRQVKNLNLASRVVVTTGISDPDRLKDIQSLNPHGLLQKPVDFQQLDTYLV